MIFHNFYASTFAHFRVPGKNKILFGSTNYHIYNHFGYVQNNPVMDRMGE